MTMRYYEDIPLGKPIESGDYRLSEEEILEYARDFDPQPFHVDPAAARASIFGGIIASGWHTCALMMRLQVESFQKGMAARGSPGFDNLRWLKPVRPGDSIRARITCVEKTPSRKRPDIGTCRLKTEVLNQRDEVVMRLVQIALYERSPGSHSAGDVQQDDAGGDQRRR
jgi:acyl dehydratase